MKRVILHIGLPKTGSTAIQNIFHRHRKELMETERLLYPGLSPNLTTPLCMLFLDDPMEHNMVKLAGWSTNEVEERRRHYRRALDEEISSASWETLLLSAEGLINLNERAMRRLSEWCSQYAGEVKILVCVRHPVAHLASLIQQRLKGGDTLQGLYDNLPVVDFAVLGCAIAAFGKESIKVFDFAGAVDSEFGLVGTFAKLVGLSDHAASAMAARASIDNESLSEAAVVVLDALNRRHPKILASGRNPRRSPSELEFLGSIGGPKYRLPPRVAARAREEAKSGVEWLNTNFDKSLYTDLLAPPGPNADEAADPASSAQVTEALAAAIGELISVQ